MEQKISNDIFPDNFCLDCSPRRFLETDKFDVQAQPTQARHWRSKSAPDENSSFTNWDISSKSFSREKEELRCMREKIDNEKPSTPKEQCGKKGHDRLDLEQDVNRLQSKLKYQKNTKGILEQALGRASSVLIPTHGNFISQHTRSLIKDIALLEFEVVQLEQHLLSLYRTALQTDFKDQSYAVKNLNVHELSRCQDEQSHQMAVSKVAQKQSVSAKLHTQSGSLGSKTIKNSIRNFSFNESKTTESKSSCITPKKDGGLRAAYSQPISFSKKETEGSPLHIACELWREVTSAGANTSNNFNETSVVGEQMSETPNKLSEELVRCMAAIYCKLADPPIPYLGPSISPSSSYSSASTYSPKELSSDGWSPHSRTDTSSVPSRDRSEQKSTLENIGMVEVNWICVDNDRLTYAAKMLRNFRYLVQQLERVNPGQLNQEEKLAFWINIYNALMMHAYLAYGIPQNHLKRASLLQKAAYKIGAHSINAHTIEHTLLGCRSHRPAQWIQVLLSPVSKIRGAHREAYALERPQPLVCFAICCGARSDPAVRVYTAKNVYHELDAAKRDFLHASVGICNENKILLPRILESFARESSIGSLDLLDWICQNVPEKLRYGIKKCMSVKRHKCIEWVPYSFNFRYLFVRDLARWFPAIPA